MGDTLKQILYEDWNDFSAVIYLSHETPLPVKSRGEEGIRLFFTMQGNVQIWTMGVEMLLGESQLALLPLEQPCEVKWLAGEAQLLQVDIFSAESSGWMQPLQSSFFSQMERAFLPLMTEEEKESVRELLRAFCRELREKENWRIECARLILQLVEVFLLRSAASLVKPQGPEQPAAFYAQSILVKKAIHYIQRHYDEEITLEELAGKLWVNPSYLSRQFKRYVGISFTEFLSQKRIYMAKAMLINSNQTVGSIAVSVGFHNIPYFNSVFKRLTGKSPTEFRREGRQGLPE